MEAKYIKHLQVLQNCGYRPLDSIAIHQRGDNYHQLHVLAKVKDSKYISVP